jgi:predicted metal-dependent hydrolase
MERHMTALPTKSKTPEGVSINARNVNFKLERALATDWADNDAVLTATFSTLFELMKRALPMRSC